VARQQERSVRSTTTAGTTFDTVFGGALDAGSAEVVNGHLAVRAGQFLDETHRRLADQAAGGEHLYLLASWPYPSPPDATRRPSSWVKRRDEIRAYRELAERAGVEATTIRYYEGIGLLAEPKRTPAGYRDYDETAAVRLRFIQAAQSLGLTLGEIREVLGFRDGGEMPCRRGPPSSRGHG
jgi:hypothetical protein